jgi:hypothetical protein
MKMVYNAFAVACSSPESLDSCLLQLADRLDELQLDAHGVVCHEFPSVGRRRPAPSHSVHGDSPPQADALTFGGFPINATNR